MYNLIMTTFILFFGMGALGPILSLYLVNCLHFTDIQAGVILSLSAISSIIAPLAGSFIADRLIPAERLLSICLFGASSMLLVLYHTHGYISFLVLYFLYLLLLAPCMSLNNTVIFHHVKDRKKDYGRIRVFGTLGWIAVAWLFSWFRLRGGGGDILTGRLPEAILVSAAAFALLGIAAFFIPAKQPVITEKVRLFPVDSVAVIKKPQVLALMAIAFLSIIIDRFYTFGSSLFLAQSGIPAQSILPFLSVGQIFEIPAMLLLGSFILKLGIRNVMMLGIACNVARYAFFILSNGNTTFILVGTLFHGLAYTFVFSSIAILLDSHTSPKSRAGVHQLFNVLASGIGALVGSLLAGAVAKAMRSKIDLSINFNYFWGIALGISIFTLFLLAFLAGRNKYPREGAPPLSWLEAE